MPPRDLPRHELMKEADIALKRYPGAKVHFKFTCEHCGERCMFQDANMLYEKGTCNECGKETVVTRGGFALLFGE